MTVGTAQLCFAQKCERSFSNISRLEEARELLLLLIENGMSEADLLLRISWTIYSDELFSELLLAFKDDPIRWKRFVEAVIHVPRRCWSVEQGGLSERVIYSQFLGLLNRSQLRRQCKIVARDRTHPLFVLLYADFFWFERISRYIQKKDFLRAWGEIGKASRGLRVGDLAPNNDYETASFAKNPDIRCYRASAETQTKLIGKLFEAMVRGGVIEPLERGDYVLIKARHYGRSFAGLSYAMRLGDVRTENGERDSVKYMLCRTGAQVVKLARTFSQPRLKVRHERFLPRISTPVNEVE